MRLSRGRVLLRVVLLVGGGAFMLARAGGSLRAARGAEGDGAVLASRLALVWALVGVLALVTAASAAWSLVRRPPRRTLRLGDAPSTRAAGDARPADDGGGARRQ